VLARQPFSSPAPYSPSPYSPSPYSPGGTGGPAGSGTSGGDLQPIGPTKPLVTDPYSPGATGGSGGSGGGGGSLQPIDPTKPLFTEPVDIGATTANTTIIPPKAIVPIKYIITLTSEDGKASIFDVLTSGNGIGNVGLHTLEPCTTYTLASVAVLADGTTMVGGNFATLTTLTT
jgi:hypothetical protein